MIVFICLIIPLLVQCGEVRNQNRLSPFNPKDMRFARRELQDIVFANEGEHCGGFISTAKQCAPGLTCVLQFPPDVGGTCQKTDVSPSPAGYTDSGDVHPIVTLPTGTETAPSSDQPTTAVPPTTAAPAQRGEECGGIEGIQCGPGLECVGQDNVPDATGTCEFVYGQPRPYVPAVVLPSGETNPPDRAYHHRPTPTATPTSPAPVVVPEFYPRETAAPSTTTTTAAPTTTTTAAPTATRKLVPVKIVPQSEFEPVAAEEPTPIPPATTTQTETGYRRPEYYHSPTPNITNGTNATATVTIAYENAVTYEPTPVPTETQATDAPLPGNESTVKFVDYEGNVIDKPHRVFRSSFRENRAAERDDAVQPAPPVFLQSASSAPQMPQPQFRRLAPRPPPYIQPLAQPPFPLAQPPFPLPQTNENENQESESSYVPWQPAGVALVEKEQNEMESESSNARAEEEMEETESLATLERQIRKTDSLVESVVDALEALRNRLPQLVSEGKHNHAKYKIERDLMKARLEKGLEGLNDEDLDVGSFIEVGSQIHRRNSLSDDNTAFLEFGEDEPSNSEIDSLFKNEPVAATRDNLANEDERIEKLLAETDEELPRKSDLNLEEDFAEISSKIESVAEKKRKHSAKAPQPSDTQDLKDAINSASKLTAQIESYIKAQIDKINAPSKSSRKKASKKNYSFLDMSSSTADEPAEQAEQSDAVQEINSETLPSIESLRKRLSDDEPQF